MPDPNREQDWVTIARLTRTRGRRGELVAIPLSSHPERYEQLEEVTLFGAQGFPDAPARLAVEEVWWHGPRLIFKFAGVDSIDAAEALRGAEVRVPFEERFALPPEEYYHSDLVGCEVIDRDSQRRLGEVTGFLEQGASGLLEVNAGGQELLIPFAAAICVEVDLARKRIVVAPPEGLLELNR